MDNYKKSLDNAVDYIMNSAEDYCQICVHFKPCNQQMEEYAKEGKHREPDRKLCKDGIRQHFIRQVEVENNAKPNNK